MERHSLDTQNATSAVKNSYINWTLSVSAIAAVMGCLHYEGPVSHWPAVFGATFIGTALLLAVGFLAVRIENRRRF